VIRALLTQAAPADPADNDKDPHVFISEKNHADII
jgi:hypothetical protein